MLENTSLIPIRLKELRNNLNLTQKEFAELINVSTVSISSYESGSKNPSLDMIINIAKKCSVSIDWLCGLSENPNPSLQIETYTDLIKLLFLLDETKAIPAKLQKKPKNPNYSNNNLYCAKDYKLTLDFDDTALIEFYDEWEDVSSIRHKTPSGGKLYDIWLKDVYERYNYKLKDTN